MKIPDLRSEKAIQSAGVKVLKQLGFETWNLSQSRASRQSAGLGDTYACGHGVCVWIEWKTAKGKQSMQQEWFQRLVEGNGGKYLLARSEADVIEWASPIVNAPKAFADIKNVYIDPKKVIDWLDERNRNIREL